MATCIGIDLAWGARGRTGLAVLDAAGRLVASTSVITDSDVDAFLAPHLGPDVVAAIDAPLVVPNAAGSRPCERQLGDVYRAYDAGAHPANRSRAYLDPPRGAVLAERRGWALDPQVAAGCGSPVAVEVYPHPATVALFGLGRVLPYKAKPGRDLDSLRTAFDALLGHLERVAGPTLRLDTSQRWAQIRLAVATARRKSELRVVEDEVDAIVCAFLAWLWVTDRERMRVFGDVETGYIVVPDRELVPPASRSASARSGPARPGLREAIAEAAPSLTGAELDRVVQAVRRSRR
ncbi:MAG: DUF429 domain-containing protein [Actinomycetales bacterium]|nr:DUF429 domain-containing protein [Actinomycetales bacterium]